MSDKDANWRFAEEFVVESDALLSARQNSTELGIEAVSPAVGAQISVIAAAAGARNMIEIGTGVGVSGLCLFEGAPEAILTSIDIEADHLQQAKKTFSEARVPSNRVRLITGRALDVLPRMNENSYDVVLVDADPGTVIEYVEHGLRLVRAGGTVVVTHALWKGRVADPAARDETTVGYRTLLKEIAGSDAVISALSPVGDGVLQLVKRRE